MTTTADRVAGRAAGARTSGRGRAGAAAAEPLSRADRAAQGKDARAAAPLESHAEFAPDGSRDPVGLTADSTKALSKLTTMDGGQRRIISDPPMVVPAEEVFSDIHASAVYEQIRAVLGKYQRTLQSDRRHLLEQFTLVQVARKVVGVGSVGTRAWIVLMDAADGVEPLFLQAKEAQPSVLAEYAGRSPYLNQGERVVAGQHLMQAQSDIFLGWATVAGADKVDRDFYVRQLKDWKFSFPIEAMIPSGMTVYAGLCGWTLARAHARSGDRVALAAYLGGSVRFDQAIAEFAEAYADQNEDDYAALQAAVKEGKVEATTEI